MNCEYKLDIHANHMRTLGNTKGGIFTSFNQLNDCLISKMHPQNAYELHYSAMALMLTWWCYLQPHL